MKFSIFNFQFSKFERFRLESGQSLVEVVVAVGLILTAVVALLSLATASMKSSGFGVTKAQATKLANEEIELVRAYRDSQMYWSYFWADVVTDASNCTTGGSRRCCINDSGALLTVTKTEETILPFTRYFNVEDISVGGANNRLRVVVRVEWVDQSGDHEVKIDAILADWQ